MSMVLLVLGHAGESHGWEFPPLHPLLVNFTAALIPASVLSDWLGRFSRRDSFQAAAWWMILYAAVVTPFTAAAGWWWRVQGNHPADSMMLWHQWLGTSMAVVAVLLAYWRWRLRHRSRAPGAAYLTAATLAVAALTVQAHLGAVMSFGATPGTAVHGHPDAGPADGEGGDKSRASTRAVDEPSDAHPHPEPHADHDHGGGKPAATDHAHEHL